MRTQNLLPSIIPSPLPSLIDSCPLPDLSRLELWGISTRHWIVCRRSQISEAYLSSWKKKTCWLSTDLSRTIRSRRMQNLKVSPLTPLTQFPARNFSNFEKRSQSVIQKVKDSYSRVGKESQLSAEMKTASSFNKHKSILDRRFEGERTRLPSLNHRSGGGVNVDGLTVKSRLSQISKIVSRAQN